MKYYFLLVLTVLFWSGNFVLGRYVSLDINAMELSFFRWFFVLLILSPYIIYNFVKLKNIFLINKLLYLIFAALGVAGYNTFVYFGLDHITSINALLINSSTPIFIILFSAFILKTKVTKIQLMGVLISTFGVLYLILKGSFQALLELDFSIYDLWIVAACISWALYSTVLKFKPSSVNAIDFLSIIVVLGVIILFFIKIIFGFNFEYIFLQERSILYTLIYMAIFPSILSFYFWNMSTDALGANKAGQFAHLMPLFGAFLSYIFLDESIMAYHVIGLLLIFLGIYLSVSKKKLV